MVKNNMQKPLKVEAMEYFMNDVFQNHLITKNHLDNKINWLLGISGLIMSLLLPFILKSEASLANFGIFIMAFSAMISFFVCLISFELPSIFTKGKPEEYSVMFYHNGTHTPQQIYEELKSIKDYDDVLKQYSITLYNLIERNIKLKNKLFKFSTYILLFGLLIGFALILASLF